MDVLDGVESLVSKNLLQQREGPEGEPRFWILETIHEYARTRLEESTDHKALQREHALYFMTMAEEAEPHLVVGQEKWLDRLEGEHDNIRAALRWARDNNETEIGLRLAGALYNFWNMRSYFTEGREQLVTLLTPEGQNSETGPAGVANLHDAARAKAFAGAGVLAWNQGDYAASLYFFEQALAIQKALDNKIGMVLLSPTSVG